MKRKNISQFIFLICFIVLVGFVSSKYLFRIDLTAEKRYTLSSETKRILSQIDETLYVEVYLDGKLPAQYRKFRKTIREKLDDFKAYSGNRLVYRFVDPSDKETDAKRNELYADLIEKGIDFVEIHNTNKDGSKSLQIVFPGAILKYKKKSMPVNLLNNNTIFPSDMQINASIEDMQINASVNSLEYELIRTINTLMKDNKESIAFTTGHGEPGITELYYLEKELNIIIMLILKPSMGK